MTARSLRPSPAAIPRRAHRLSAVPALGRVGFGAALLFLASPASATVTTQVGVEHESFSFQTYRGDVEVVQTRIPVDVRGHRSSVDWSLGADFASSRVEDWSADGSLSGPASLRAGVGRAWASGRIRFSATARLALETGPYDADERLLLSWIAQPELDLPVSSIGQGSGYRLGASARLFASKRGAVFLGAFFAAETVFDLRDDGLELDPSDRLGAGLGYERGWSGGSARTQLFVEHPTDGRIDGRAAYTLGDRLRARIELEQSLAAGRGWAYAEVLGAESGEILPGWVLQSSWVRGGNRAVWALGWETVATAYWGAALVGTHYRGFSGSLGHSDWFTPRLSLGRRSSGGDLRVEAAFRVGSVREGRSLDGLGLGISWTREWSR